MRSVLFVDDDPKLLQGLRRMLHGLRAQWQMSFASEGRQALARMEEQPFDVVVSDMRMPGMDGSQLLGEIMTRFPTTVRIVLSGQCDRETVLKAILPAHQFLTKPCDSNLLRTTVERACQLQEMVAETELREKVSRVISLPCTIASYLQLQANVSAAEASIKRIAESIAADVAASAKVLQLVSTGFFCSPQKSIGAEHAVLLLGLETIESLTASPHVFRPAPRPEIDTICQHIAAHSLQVAQRAHAIAACETNDSEAALQAYVAGMLHDVGNLILIEDLADNVQAAECWHSENEHQTIKHAAVGGYLLGLWGLPDAVVNAAAFHHLPSLSADMNFTALTAVHVADVFSTQNSDGNAANTRKPDRDYLARINCSNRLDHWLKAATSESAMLPSNA
ncbi:MAG: HDOD domain-containing protein [Thermoguttaceae bacterium]